VKTGERGEGGSGGYCYELLRVQRFDGLGNQTTAESGYPGITNLFPEGSR